MGGWIGVDLDGTLAQYDVWRGPSHIGDPVPAMQALVIDMLRAGLDVRIFTARVCRTNVFRAAAEAAIREWCVRHLGCELLVTAEKDFHMVLLYDDRCVTVEANTGRLLTWGGDKKRPGQGGKDGV